MKVRVLDPKHGDRVHTLTPRQAAGLILERKKEKKVAFVKFSDDSQMNLPPVPRNYTGAQIQDMMERTGILQQLQEKEKLGVNATLVPAVGGG